MSEGMIPLRTATDVRNAEIARRVRAWSRLQVVQDVLIWLIRNAILALIVLGLVWACFRVALNIGALIGGYPQPQ